MKKLINYLTALLFIIWSISCQKEISEISAESYIKVFPAITSMAPSNIVQLDDGNYIMAGYEYHTTLSYPRNPGMIIKFDGNGKGYWTKKVSAYNTTLFKALPLPGTGFLTFGFNDLLSNKMYICTYNYSGDTLATYEIIHLEGNNSYMSNFDIIRLSNGNYAIAGGSEYDKLHGYLIILDPNFNKLSGNIIASDPAFYFLTIHGLTEMQNGGIAMCATTVFVKPEQDSAWNDKKIYQAELIRTSVSGSVDSTSLVNDLNFDETPSLIAESNNRIYMITSRKQPFNTGAGTFVNYVLNRNSWGLFVSGSICIVSFDKNGNSPERKFIDDYPGNGLITSLRKTNDGGFICCGTVDQLSSPSLISNTKIYLLKLDADFNMQWSKTIHSTYPSYGVDAIQTNDGGYLIGGYYNSMNQRFEMMVMKTDANGNY